MNDVDDVVGKWLVIEMGGVSRKSSYAYISVVSTEGLGVDGSSR